MLSIEHLQWLEKSILSSRFSQKLIDLGYEDFVKDVQKEVKKDILEYRQKNK